MRLTHLIAGPAEHGVTEYALALAHSTGGRVVRWEELLQGEDHLDDGPVHVTFTDHLFGHSPDEAVDAVLTAVGGRALSVSFHDVPQPGEGEDRYRHRTRAYRRLARQAQVTVTNSRHEAAFFDEDQEVAVIYLPLPQVPEQEQPADDTDRVSRSVGVLGFIYPGKGHDEVARAAAAVGGLRVRALGGYSRGHEDMDLPGVEITGYLSDSDLWREMATIDIPVCAHRHVSASGSLMRWLAAGRRVLVADSPYAREIAQLCPGQVQPYTDLDTALRSVDPDFHVPLPRDQRWTHNWADVASAYQDLWIAAFGPHLVGNNLPALTGEEPAGISVVIPHYNDEDSLAQVIAGVERAAEKVSCPIEIIVADDGSDREPVVTSTLPLTVVRQADQGFRAAAARNLGARSASHPVLCFLDADTVPDSDYLLAAARWPSAHPRCVVIGARLQEGVEPHWLRDAWERTHNLLGADDSSWRYVISSVLTVSSDFFHELGGFDASMVGYGGEDWEFGFRAWNAGAVFIHEPAATAHHLEPEWAERAGDKTSEKNAETIALAHRITHPMARPEGVYFSTPDITVELPANADETVVTAWLRSGDITVTGPSSALFDADPRVNPKVNSAHVTPRVRVTLSTSVYPPQDLGEVVRKVELLGGHAVLVNSPDSAPQRTIGRIHTRRNDGTNHPAVVHVDMSNARDHVSLERWCAGW